MRVSSVFLFEASTLRENDFDHTEKSIFIHTFLGEGEILKMFTSVQTKGFPKTAAHPKLTL